ncbi:MAG: hypothetical protein ACYC3O_02905 [Burkholderiales bacterium]
MAIASRELCQLKSEFVMNERNIHDYILPTSATMVRVCVTVITVRKLMGARKQIMHGISIIKILLTADTLLFLFSALFF